MKSAPKKPPTNITTKLTTREVLDIVKQAVEVPEGFVIERAEFVQIRRDGEWVLTGAEVDMVPIKKCGSGDPF